MFDNRRQELLDLVTREGIALPMSIEEILALEDDGHVVDLETGHIITGGAELRVSLTVAGEAELLVQELES